MVITIIFCSICRKLQIKFPLPVVLRRKNRYSRSPRTFGLNILHNYLKCAFFFWISEKRKKKKNLHFILFLHLCSRSSLAGLVHFFRFEKESSFFSFSCCFCIYVIETHYFFYSFLIFLLLLEDVGEIS